MKSKNTVNQGHYGHLRGLLNLAKRLQTRPMKKNEIAEFLGCSLRTADRSIGALQEIYQGQLNKDNDHFWWLDNGAAIPAVDFKAQDVHFFYRLVQELRSQNREDDASYLQTLIAKIPIEKPAKTESDLDVLILSENYACRPRPYQKIASDVLKKTRLAIEHNYRIEVEYHNKRSGKTNINTLEPYGVLYSDKASYLLARHADGYFGDEIHQFLIANIKSVEVLDEKFIPLKFGEKGELFDIKKYARHSFGVFQEKPFSVEWKFSAKAATEAEKYLLHPTQTMKRNEDGTLTVTFKAGGTLEMAWHLYTWGKEVEVVKPKNFWQRVQKAEAERWR